MSPQFVEQIATSPLAARSRAVEEMDDPGLDPAVYTAVLRDLGRVNALTLAARPTLSFLSRAARTRDRFRLLDVGFGDGDMLRRIARWAAERHIAAELVGVDINEKSLAAARAATPPECPIEYLHCDYRDVSGPIDFVVSCEVTHHMSDDEIRTFLRFMERRARCGWIINDLHRHAFAYYGFPLLARAMRWHRIVRDDGRRSIAKSFRPSDWRRLLDTSGIPHPDAPRIVRRFPFRICVEAGSRC